MGTLEVRAVADGIDFEHVELHLPGTIHWVVRFQDKESTAASMLSCGIRERRV